VKLLAAIAVAAATVVLTATSSTSGATRPVEHHALGLVPHFAHSSRFAPTRRATKATGFNCIAACSSYEGTINQYFTDVAAASAANATDNVYSVATQYPGITYGSTFGGSYVAGNPFPTNTCQDGVDKYCLTDSQLQTEIGKVIAAKGWPLASQTALYFIFTPANVGECIFAGQPTVNNACTTTTFCAYHSNTSTNSFIYAVEPDAAAVSDHACVTGQAPRGSAADATINTVSHEQNEAITDPYGTAWYSNDATDEFPEIGDLCAYDFGTPLGNPGGEYNQVINGHDYYLQLEYSNQDGGCVPSLGGPVSPADPHDGYGPLANTGAGRSGSGHGGPVMTTNTVYAIYWVPAPPANRSLPTISGTPKVGKKLTASHGAWTNLPTYTYRWLRCTSAGTSCKAISAATTLSYKPVAADKWHRLEVRVTATNAAGIVSATSAPTAVVKG
jgi:hypothetical protein